MKRCNKVALLLVFFLLLTGCKMGNQNNPIDKTDFAMDTYIVQKIYDSRGEDVAKIAIERIKELEGYFSAFLDGSDVNKINENAGLSPIGVNKETIEAIDRAMHFSNLSKGAYDITVGPLVFLWDINGENSKVPDDHEIKEALNLIDYKDISVYGESVQLNRRDQKIDLGSIGKGVACDEAVKIYNEEKVSGLIMVGSTIGVVGDRGKGNKFKIGVRDPRGDSGSYIGILKLKDTCVSTSGDYERFFEANGTRYHHILDPRTGYPANSGLISVTIVSKSGVDSDILSTACFVLGLDKGMELLSKVEAEGIFIDVNRNVYITDGLKDNFIFKGEEKGYSLKVY